MFKVLIESNLLLWCCLRISISLLWNGVCYFTILSFGSCYNSSSSRRSQRSRLKELNYKWVVDKNLIVSLEVEDFFYSMTLFFWMKFSGFFCVLEKCDLFWDYRSSLVVLKVVLKSTGSFLSTLPSELKVFDILFRS